MSPESGWGRAATSTSCFPSTGPANPYAVSGGVVVADRPQAPARQFNTRGHETGSLTIFLSLFFFHSQIPFSFFPASLFAGLSDDASLLPAAIIAAADWDGQAAAFFPLTPHDVCEMCVLLDVFVSAIDAITAFSDDVSIARSCDYVNQP